MSGADDGLAITPDGPSSAAPEPRPTFRPPPQRWCLASPDPATAASLAAEARLPQVIAELLLSRGIATPTTAQDFRSPSLDHLHDPMSMRGMAEAVARLQWAIANRETILLYGDYDVDGTTAVVLLKTAIEMAVGNKDAESCASVQFHVPHRLREGYGMQSAILEAAYAEGVRLVITVDTGMRAFAEARRARELGLDLIITDHHLPDAGDDLPEALAILNPNQPGCAYPEKGLCGAAIAFKLAQGLLERTAGISPSRVRDKILPSFLKMVAIATVADAVPLRGENRVLVSIGIAELARPAGTGLRALLQAALLDPSAKPLTSFDLGFRLGPRINAAGRMDVAAEVVELFTTRDPLRARELAQKLERLNTERRETEASALREVESLLTSDPDFAERRILVMAGHGWHRGVIGILASRIVDRTAKPAIVVSIEDGVAYGSGRSIDGFPLLEAIGTCSDLFTRFGGHAFAVGFALPAERLTEMEQRLYRFAHEKLAGKPVERTLHIHAELPLDRVTPAIAEWLRRLEPFGHGNPEPVLVARNLRLTSQVRLMKEKHIRLDLSPARISSGPRQAPIQLVGWNLAERARELSLAKGSIVDVAYRVRENDHPQYGGLQLEIAGLALAT